MSNVTWEPAGSDKAPALVLVQEWWGVNDQIKSVADRLAGEGFLVSLPDLYHGKVARDGAEAGRLMQALDKAKALSELQAAARALLAHPRSNGKVGAIGFCLGGAFSFALAATLPELSAAVPFYGLPDANLRFDKTNAPVQAHFSKTDGWATPAGAEKIKAELAAAGKLMELHLYDADHAFMNDTRPAVYSPENAKVAWQRAISFLNAHLA